MSTIDNLTITGSIYYSKYGVSSDDIIPHVFGFIRAGDTGITSLPYDRFVVSKDITSNVYVSAPVGKYNDVYFMGDLDGDNLPKIQNKAFTNEISSQIDTNTSDISTANTSITSINSSLSTLTTQIGTNEANIENNTTTLADHSSSIATLQSRTTKLSYNSGTDTSTLNSKVLINNTMTHGNVTFTQGTDYYIYNSTPTGTINFTVTDVSSITRTMTIDQFVNLSGINDIHANKVYISGTQVDITTINSTLSSHTSTLSSHTSSISTNQTNIMNNVTDIAIANANIASNTSTIGTNTTNISTLQTKTTDITRTGSVTAITNLGILTWDTTTGYLNQSSISGDFSTTNSLRRTTIKTKLSDWTTGTSSPSFTISDDNGGNTRAIHFIPNCTQGVYTGLAALNGQLITTSSKDNTTLTIAPWSSLQLGIKMTASSTTTGTIIVKAGNNHIQINETDFTFINTTTNLQKISTSSITNYLPTQISLSSYTPNSLAYVGYTTITNLSTLNHGTVSSPASHGSITLPYIGVYTITIQYRYDPVATTTSTTKLGYCLFTTSAQFPPLGTQYSAFHVNNWRAETVDNPGNSCLTSTGTTTITSANTVLYLNYQHAFTGSNVNSYIAIFITRVA